MSALPLRDRLQRRTVPRVVVALSTVRAPRRWAAGVRRALGGQAVVRLHVAFDDPLSAVALLGMREVVAGRRVRLVVVPVVARGIPGDPAVEAKRRYAVLQRSGLALRRTAPLDAEACGSVARWTAALPAGERAAFAAAAARVLWLESDGPVPAAALEALWREHTGRPLPAPHDGARALRRSEASTRLRRLYDTPVAVVHGQWFFAHERLAQIGHRLDELGWKVTA
jgi:2-hydroxychromene-2-carboxylate isomerase